jgi:hypothetical protein
MQRIAHIKSLSRANLSSFTPRSTLLRATRKETKKKNRLKTKRQRGGRWVRFPRSLSSSTVYHHHAGKHALPLSICSNNAVLMNCLMRFGLATLLAHSQPPPSTRDLVVCWTICGYLTLFVVYNFASSRVFRIMSKQFDSGTWGERVYFIMPQN